MSSPVPLKKGKLFAANNNLTAYFKNHSPLTQGALLDQVHRSYQVYATGDVMSNWQVIDSRVNTQATKDQEKYWKAWQRYANT